MTFATMVVHWPSGPVPMCIEHADQAVNIGNAMGLHVALTAADPGSECTTCKNAGHVGDAFKYKVDNGKAD